MARINLLPWREELRQQRQQEFLIAMGASVVATCILFGLVYMHIEGMKEYQQQRNDRVTHEIEEVDKKIKEIEEIEAKKSKLNAKIDLIKGLQESRPEIVHVLDELRKITPIGIYLTKVEQKEKVITISGKSEVNSKVSDYMKAVEQSIWLTEPILKYVKGMGVQEEKGKMSDFILEVKQKETKKEEPADAKPEEVKTEAKPQDVKTEAK